MVKKKLRKCTKDRKSQWRRTGLERKGVVKGSQDSISAMGLQTSQRADSVVGRLCGAGRSLRKPQAPRVNTAGFDWERSMVWRLESVLKRLSPKRQQHRVGVSFLWGGVRPERVV